MKRGERQLDLRPGQSVELLKELHILTRDGRINQDSRRKLKQVYHLYQFIEKLLLELPADGARPTLADHGAGKSYLGFILYDLFFKPRGGGHIYGIETRAELVEKSRALAARLGFERMSFLNLSAAECGRRARLAGAHRRRDGAARVRHRDRRRDRVRPAQGGALHGAGALLPGRDRRRACAQNKALALARTPLAELWRHPLHTREMGSQLTNVLRCLYLEACGYQVTVTELVGWEHSLKNELILARRTGQRKRSAARAPARRAAEFGLQVALEPQLARILGSAA